MRWLSMVVVAVLVCCANGAEQSNENEATAVSPAETNAKRTAIVPESAIRDVQEGRFELAVPAYRKAVELNPNDASTRRSLGLILIKSGDIGGGIKELERALVLDPTNAEEYVALATIQMKVGNYADAERNWTASLSIKDSSETRLLHAYFLYHSNQNPAAIDECSAVIARDPDNQQAHAFRANANMRHGAVDAARRDARRALELGGTFDALAYLVLGVTEADKPDPSASIENLTKSISLDPRQPLTYIFRAMCRAMSKEYSLALTDLDAAIATCNGPAELNTTLDGRAWQLYKFRGSVEILADNYSDAIEDMTQAIALNPSDNDLYALRGWARLMHSEWKLSIDDFNKALDTNPEDHLAILGLSKIYASCPDDALRNGQLAIDMAAKGCELTDWKNAVFIEELAAANAEKQDFEKAISLQKRALVTLQNSERGVSYVFKVWWNATIDMKFGVQKDIAQLQQFMEHKPRRLKIASTAKLQSDSTNAGTTNTLK